MRIALVSYEFVGTSASGGIGTYTRNAAEMLANRGHDVEVFTSASPPSAVLSTLSYVVNVVHGDRDEFRRLLPAVFAVRHSRLRFDVVEGPEFAHEASELRCAFPHVPLVVRLHAPTFTIDASNLYYVPLRKRLRFLLGSLRRGKIRRDPWTYDVSRDPECIHSLSADLIAANSLATMRRVGAKWNLPKDRLTHVPCVFSPSRELLDIGEPVDPQLVTFVGRLEVRKGVIELARAIPIIRSRVPNARFRFVGRCLPHPADQRSLAEHIISLVGVHKSAVEIVGGVPYEQLPFELASSSICVFPSDWEASGIVCMEAMAAGRAVIGSAAGGMSEIIEDGKSGLIVPREIPMPLLMPLFFYYKILLFGHHWGRKRDHGCG